MKTSTHLFLVQPHTPRPGAPSSVETADAPPAGSPDSVHLSGAQADEAVECFRPDPDSVVGKAAVRSLLRPAAALAIAVVAYGLNRLAERD